MHPPRVVTFVVLVAACLSMPLSTEARKFLIAKPPVVDPVSVAISHPSLDTSKLRALGATILGEYYTYYLVQVPDSAASAFSAAASQAGFSAQEKPSFDEINVNGYRFPSGSVPPLPGDLAIPDYRGPVGLYLVQFVGPQKPEWLAQITTFAEIVRYYPENTFLVRTAPANAGKFGGLASVQHSSVFQPAFKVRQDLLEAVGPTFVTVQLDSGQNLASIGSMLQSLGPTDQADLTACGPFCNVSLTLLPGEAMALATQPEVLWIEPVLPAEPSDERQTLTLSGHSAETPPGSMVWKPTSPTGYQQWLESKHFCTSTKTTDCWNYWTRVAVFDSGLDSNVCGQQPASCLAQGDTHLVHPDLTAREYRYFCGLDDNCVSGSKYDYSDNCGHGTMVASIIAGDPVAGVAAPPNQALGEFSLNSYQDPYYLGSGVAPLAQVVEYRIWGNGCWGRTFTPSMLRTWHANLLLLGEHVARFGNHSWNTGGDTSYSTLSQMLDNLVRDSDGLFDHTDSRHMTLTVSAGNQGGYVTSPATAKNVITVGATENWPASDVSPWLTGCPSTSYPHESVRNVPSFSNRAVDSVPNVFKPDVMAVGNGVSGAFTTTHGYVAGMVCDPPQPGDPNNGYYIRSGGTSFAAPAIAGAAILAEIWSLNYGATYPANTFPSPAMLKALLLAHSEPLTNGLDRLTGLRIGPRPSYVQGWGMPNLDTLLQRTTQVTLLDQDARVGGARRFVPGMGSWDATLSRTNPAGDVILAIAWTDVPMALGAGYLLVNNLDIYAINNGYIFQGNYFDASDYTHKWQGTAYPDVANNVEIIRIRASDLTGNTLSVEIVPTLNGRAVPGLDGTSFNQDFALYVYNAQCVSCP